MAAQGWRAVAEAAPNARAHTRCARIASSHRGVSLPLDLIAASCALRRPTQTGRKSRGSLTGSTARCAGTVPGFPVHVHFEMLGGVACVRRTHLLEQAGRVPQIEQPGPLVIRSFRLARAPWNHRRVVASALQDQLTVLPAAQYRLPALGTRQAACGVIHVHARGPRQGGQFDGRRCPRLIAVRHPASRRDEPANDKSRHPTPNPAPGHAGADENIG